MRNIDHTKEGTLLDPSYQTPYAVHVNLGVQRELASDLVVSADVVWRQFIHAFMSGIDYNRFNDPRGPVIPNCTLARRNDDQAVCSNGSIMFDTTFGRARYKGLLVRVEKRLSRGTQFLASYALGSYVGTNGTSSAATGTGFNNDNWLENDGPLPTDRRHVLNLSGFMDLPWALHVAVSVSAYSRPPFSAWVRGVDFNGDGTRNDLLPGTTVNQFGGGLDRDDLVKLVNAYNEQYANRLTAGGQRAPLVTLPGNYAFNDSFFTEDVRLTRSVQLSRGQARLSLIAEVFNVLNTANLVGYRGDLTNRATFGQPTDRSTQVFGSGGPRAFQFGARVSF